MKKMGTREIRAPSREHFHVQLLKYFCSLAFLWGRPSDPHLPFTSLAYLSSLFCYSVQTTFLPLIFFKFVMCLFCTPFYLTKGCGHNGVLLAERPLPPVCVVWCHTSPTHACINFILRWKPIQPCRFANTQKKYLNSGSSLTGVCLKNFNSPSIRPLRKKTMWTIKPLAHLTAWAI